MEEYRRYAAGLAALVVTASAVGSAAPRTGGYHVTKGFRFTFSVKSATCTTPPDNLRNSKAHAGPKKKGLCFHSFDQPPIKVHCPAPARSTGDRMLILSFDGLLLQNGKLHVKAYIYSSGPKPIGWYELSLQIRGGKASGFVRKMGQVYGGASEPVNCDSGRMAFTAAHS